MNHDTTTLAGKIAIMQAAENGAEIQATEHNFNHWSRFGEGAKPVWNWAEFDYRINPREPKVIWVNEYTHDLAAYLHEQQAKNNSLPNALRIAVKYIEVLEEMK